MGYPIKSLKDILTNKDEISMMYPNSSYAFILYKNEHTKFKNFILRNFNMFDDHSPEIIFFLLDYPEEWFNNYRRQDHVKLHGQEYRYHLRDHEVEKVIEHFNISEFQLPMVITFKSLNSYKSSVFSLSNIQMDEFALMDFFTTLFRPLNNQETYYSRSQYIHSNFDGIASKVVGNPNKDKIFVVFEKIIEAIELIDEEAISELPELAAVKQFLENILDSFLESKEFFKEKILELETALKQSDSVEIEKEIEKLHHSADSKLYEFQQNFWFGEETLQSLLGRTHYFASIFEEESLSMIRSSLLTEKTMKQLDVSDYDYSLFAVGYWKALEIELNIVVADAIRMLHNYVNSIPSRGYSTRKDKLLVEGMRRRKVIQINVNEYQSNERKDLMFGQIIQLMDYADGNGYIEVLDQITKKLKTLEQQQQFRLKLINDLKEIVYEYRNKGSHTSKLTEQDLQKVKNILFEQNGLYHRIAKIKVSLVK